MIQIGKLVNTHGLIGEVRILSNSDFVEKRFKVGNYILVGKNTKFKIEEMYTHKNFIICKFEGIKNINEIIKYKGQNIYGGLLTVEELDEDEFLVQELVGMSVIQNDIEIGKVTEVIEMPTSEILRVNKKTLIPFLKQFIVNVDRKNKQITVELLEGMIESED